MNIHREGHTILSIIFLFLTIVNIAVFLLPIHPLLIGGTTAVSVILLIFFLRFFRNPFRQSSLPENMLLSPADGKVVVVEEITDTEYFNDKRIQISVFMSIYDVHLNRIPISGKVKHFNYKTGKFMLARHPKASGLNEQAVTVIDTGKEEILIKQIAGAAARRIKTYVKEGNEVKRGEELGFIKFGSRADILLPIGSDIKVKIGDHVKGGIDVLAVF